jgi:hypothetical protein
MGQRAFATASWRHLVMLNFAVDPSLLMEHVPAETQLDSFEGRTYLSVVAFSFEKLRVLGVPIWGCRDFAEVNLRFYVRREHQGEVRRGVVFIREIAPRWLVSAAARLLYNEKYVTRPMRRELESTEERPQAGQPVEYAWRSEDRWRRVGATPARELATPEDDSLEAFIVEHYWGYGVDRRGRTQEYQVKHPRWSVATAADVVWDCDPVATYGERLGAHLQGEPDSALVVDGSPVELFWRRTIRAPHLAAVKSPI